MTKNNSSVGEKPGIEFSGRYCEGRGDVGFLRLVDESFQFFHAGEQLPNLTMLYKAEWDTFSEGAGWVYWWIQNSYGFSYCATPFLQEPWISILQRSWDLHWDNQGDGKRMGLLGGSPNANHLSPLVAPDGCLGDCAAPGEIAYKQGDGDAGVHDWFYEATAAALVMQAEILLRNRDVSAVMKYMPRMERACEFIERARDPRNNLFLVGPACNLLAPSYGGVRMPDGTFGKGYLTGLSITYTAALDRMVELYKLIGDKTKLGTCQHRLKITCESLRQLQTDKGYFCKSMESDGTKHGVLGQEKYAYLEGVANADALAFRVADDQTAVKIYDQIAAFKEIRPFDFLLTNAPGLDDTYWNWGKTEPLPGPFCQFGDWVNGGVWGTVEGRAIMGYYRLNKFDDIRRSANRAMKWAKDYRMDAPWCQRGENTNNLWSDTGKNKVGSVAVMVDNFAIPAATVRGLFEYIYKADRLILYPHIPQSVTAYAQKEPVWFGGKAIYISLRNGSGRIKSVKVNGQCVSVDAADHFSLEYNSLPRNAKVEVEMDGAKATVVAIPPSAPTKKEQADLSETLKKPYAAFTAIRDILKDEQGADYERAFVAESIGAIDAWRARVGLDLGPGHYRAITPERRKGIIEFHEKAALSMYSGFEAMMKRYAEGGNQRERRVARRMTR